MTTLYTIGTSTRTIEEFVEILRHHGIVHVVDVRRFPTSRLEHFRKENLRAHLREAGLHYTYLGDLLGGYRRGGYEAYTRTEPFQRGLRRLLEIARIEPTVLICAERLPWRCHRRWIAQEAARAGLQVVHIIERDRLWRPALGGMPLEGKRPLALRLKELYEEISPLIEGFTSEVCPHCEDVCCRHRHGHLEAEDEVFLTVLGEDVPLASRDRDDDDWCEFLGPKGCTKPRWQRPFRCTWYFCEALLRHMPEANPKALRRLQALMQEIQALRRALAANL